MSDEFDRTRRRQWVEGPERPGPPESWLALSDDDLLYRIEALRPGHGEDAQLVQVMRSNRHFFIRQEAAKKIGDHDMRKEHSHDRHIGQILVRGMNRREDATYLERLAAESRHLEVRKAAEAQLRLIAERIAAATRPSGSGDKK